MKILWAIIPAAVLSIGAGALGVCKGTSAEKDQRLAMRHSSFGQIIQKAAEVSETSAVNAPIEVQSNFVDDNIHAFCDNYIDGVCWQNGSVCGYHHANGNYVDNNNDGFCDNYIDGVCWQNGSNCGYHNGKENHHGNNNHHGNGKHH